MLLDGATRIADRLPPDSPRTRPLRRIQPVKIVIVGCGRVGSTLARRMAEEGHDVSIVDENLSSFARLGEEFGGQMVVGSGIDEEVLRRAGIEQSDCFASVTNGDNRNIMAAQIAKEVFKVKRVITRIYDPIRADVYRELGLETICPTTISAALPEEFFETGHNSAQSGTVVPRPAGAPG
jgi:trk system potassium uptake protein